MRIERSEGCCGNLERGKSQEQAEDLGLDPTLASCCQRDIKEQQRVAYAKKALLSVDRIDKRSRESRTVLGLGPPAQAEDSQSPDFSDISDDEEGDSHMSRWSCEVLRK